MDRHELEDEKTLAEARLFAEGLAAADQQAFDPAGRSAGNVEAIDVVDAKHNARRCGRASFLGLYFYNYDLHPHMILT
jgi:hypothetical protein